MYKYIDQFWNFNELWSKLNTEATLDEVNINAPTLEIPICLLCQFLWGKHTQLDLWHRQHQSGKTGKIRCWSYRYQSVLPGELEKQATDTLILPGKLDREIIDIQTLPGELVREAVDISSLPRKVRQGNYRHPNTTETIRWGSYRYLSTVSRNIDSEIIDTPILPVKLHCMCICYSEYV